MQHILLPDYFKNDIKCKYENVDEFAYVFKLINSPEFGMSLGRDSLIFKENYLPKFVEDIIESLPSTVLALMCMIKNYIDNNGTNYVVSENLSVALSDSKLDLKHSYFPEKFNDFIYIPNFKLKKSDGEYLTVIGTFVSIEEDIFQASMVWDPKDSGQVGLASLIFRINRKELHKKIPTKFEYLDGKKGTNDHSDLESCADVIYRQLLNAITYISNTNEPLNEEINKFPSKASKQIAQKKIYTSLPFIRVGVNFNLPKQYSVDHSVVSGHYRWQPYGEGREQVKLIYIDPHFRHYKNINGFESV